MECPLFHIDAFLNDYIPTTALIDNGSMAYALISRKFARRIGLPFLEIPLRRLQGVQDFGGIRSDIAEVTTFSLDIGAHKIQKVFAYVVPYQLEELILGRPWLQQQGACVDEGTSRLVFKDGTSIPSREASKRNPHSPYNTLQVSQILASTYAGLAKRSKKERGIQLFAATLTDIEKALSPKPKLSLPEIIERLPKHTNSIYRHST